MSTPQTDIVGTDYTEMGASFGLAPILSQLQVLSTKRVRPTWDACLVNVQTFIRNSQKKDIPPKQLIAAVYQDMNLFQQYFGFYHNTGQNPIKPVIIFYLPFYYLEASYARALSPALQEQQNIAELMSKNWNQQVQDTPDTKILTIKAGTKKVLPHLAVLETLADVLPKYRHLSIAGISHVILDFYLSNHLLKFSLLESFTGQIKTKLNWSDKVFKNPNIPFCPLTHILMGDGQYVKRWLPDRKSVIVFKELAAAKKWKYSSETQARKDLIAKNVIPYGFSHNLLV